MNRSLAWNVLLATLILGAVIGGTWAVLARLVRWVGEWM